MANKKSKKKEQLEDAISSIVVDFVTYFVGHVKDKLFSGFSLHKKPKELFQKHLKATILNIVGTVLISLGIVELIIKYTFFQKECGFIIVGIILFLSAYFIKKNKN